MQWIGRGDGNHRGQQAVLQPDTGSGSKGAAMKGAAAGQQVLPCDRPPAGGAKLCPGPSMVDLPQRSQGASLGKEWEVVGYAGGSAAALLGIAYRSSRVHR
jgi:hypothetical protein